MRIKRIVAERFGSLESSVLGDLGEGLTVVLGPNEAGKTSFTNLVRYVLYGYPRKGSEPGYESSAGKRLGRLVFTDTGGEWTFERTDGPHGGPLAIHTVSGSDQPGLIDTVTSGISRDAFRIVFGFGLDEMAQIESGRGSGVDILSRLYAAQVGLDVSPSDVRMGLDAAAADLWRKGGSKPELNAIKARITEVRRALGDLEMKAAAYARGREELADLYGRVQDAHVARETASIRLNEIAAALQELTDLDSRITELEEKAATESAEAATARDELARIEVDEATLSAAVDLTSLLEELSGFRQRFEQVRAKELEIGMQTAAAQAALEEAGIDACAADAVDMGPDTMPGVLRWRDRLATLESQSVASRREADRTADAVASSAPGFVPGAGAWAPGAVLAVLGIAIAAGGAFSADYVQAFLGLLVITTGGALLLRARAFVGAPRLASTAPQSAAADAARAAFDRDTRALEDARAEWDDWVAQRGLATAGSDPATVSIVVDAIKRFRTATAQAQRLTLAREHDVRECEAYRERLASVAGQAAPDLASAALADVPLHAARIKDALDRATADDAKRRDLLATLSRVERSLADARERAVAARDRRAALLAEWGLAGADSMRLQAHRSVAEDAAREATAAYDAVAAEYTALATHLDAEGRDSEMAELRLELAGLEERRDAAIDRYAVLAVAERLMARTQAYNEQARQPAVVARASELFATITHGRYVRLSVPSDGSEFLVFDAESRPTPSSRLSTGTAQQLYLALRIALIETLDEKGPGLPVLMDDVLVNFDPERKLGAARAVAELAAHRQVVVFTCHPETAGLFESVQADHVLIQLDRCG